MRMYTFLFYKNNKAQIWCEVFKKIMKKSKLRLFMVIGRPSKVSCICLAGYACVGMEILENSVNQSKV